MSTVARVLITIAVLITAAMCEMAAVTGERGASTFWGGSAFIFALACAVVGFVWAVDR